MARVIVWNKRPSRFLAQVLKWISADSIVQAERVEKEILAAISNIPANPEQHPLTNSRKTIRATSGLLKSCPSGFLIKSQPPKSEYCVSGM
jgi:hypothetical protein